MTYKELFTALDVSDIDNQAKFSILFILIQWMRDYGYLAFDQVDFSSVVSAK